MPWIFTEFILPKLVSFKRRQRILKEDWSHLKGLQLADPDYDKPGLGTILEADVYASLRDGFRNDCPGDPIAHCTMMAIDGNTYPNESHSESDNKFQVPFMEPDLILMIEDLHKF